MTKRILAGLTSGLKFGAMATVIAGSVTLIDPVFAQSNEVSALQNQVTSLRQAIKDLQLKVYKGQDPESINLVSGGAAENAQASQTQAKIFELEESLRDLTGQYEVLDNRARRIETRLDKLIEDIDFRLTNLEQNAIAGAGAAGVAANNPNAAGQQAAQAGQQPTTVVSSTGTTTVAPTTSNQAGVLGTLTEDQMQNFENGTAAAAQQNSQATDTALVTENSVATTETLPETQGTDVLAVTPRYETPEEEYKAAYGMLQKHDWDAAERAMKGFIDHYPQHALVGNAMYWLGETHYARKQYGDAMSSFAATYQHDEKGRKAPDSLLKLGMSLAQLGEVDQSCVTYDVLLTKHSDANQVVLRKAQQRKEAQNCPTQ